MATLEIQLVLGADGTVDTDATLAAALGRVQQYKASKETEESTISGHLSALFDQLKADGTKNVNMPYVINNVLTRMNVQAMPSSYNTLFARVHTFIQANSQGKTLDKATGKVERPDSTFVIGKGKNGGVFRRSDLPANAPVET
jgi:hypothetical protein